MEMVKDSISNFGMHTQRIWLKIQILGLIPEILIQ